MDKKDLEVKQNLVKGLNEVLSKAILDSSEAEILKLSDNFQKVIESKPVDNFFSETLNLRAIESYVELWRQNTEEILGLKLNSFPTIQNALDGLQPGFIVIGADANVGKTGLLISLATDIIKSNDNAFVIFVTGDDLKGTILTRMISNVGKTTKINHIKKLGYYSKQKGKESKNIIESLNEACYILCNKIAIYDTESIRSFSDIESAIQAHAKEGARMVWYEDESGKEYKAPEHENRQIVVCIDALLNLDTDKSSLEVRMENERRAVLSKNIVKKYEVPVITTAELKKPNSKGKEESKPSIHDIAETRKYSFEADAIFLLRNKNTIDKNEPNEVIDIVCDIAKNKLSNIKTELDLEYHVTKSWFREKKPGNTQNITKEQKEQFEEQRKKLNNLKTI